jgi:hypothetical protein
VPPRYPSASAQHEIDKRAHPERQLLLDRGAPDSEPFRRLSGRQTLHLAKPDDFPAPRRERVHARLRAPKLVPRRQKPLGREQIDCPVDLLEIRDQIE